LRLSPSKAPNLQNPLVIDLHGQAAQMVFDLIMTSIYKEQSSAQLHTVSYIKNIHEDIFQKSSLLEDQERNGRIYIYIYIYICKTRCEKVSEIKWPKIGSQDGLLQDAASRSTTLKLAA
jgi:hypothetical protein